MDSLTLDVVLAGHCYAEQVAFIGRLEFKTMPKLSFHPFKESPDSGET